MSLLRLRETNETPPDGFRYVEPEDGYRIGPHNSKSGWLDAILKHKQDNGYPIPSNWREEAEDQLARILPPGWAFYEDGSMPDYSINTRMSGDTVIAGTKALLDIIRRVVAFKLFGMDTPIVSRELAESRSLTCSRCPYNIPIEGCFSCTGIANIIADVASGIETPSDPMVRSCAICGCSNKAQTRIKAEVLRELVTPDQMTMFNGVPWCWKGREISELS